MNDYLNLDYVIWSTNKWLKISLIIKRLWEMAMQFLKTERGCINDK